MCHQQAPAVEAALALCYGLVAFLVMCGLADHAVSNGAGAGAVLLRCTPMILWICVCGYVVVRALCTLIAERSAGAEWPAPTACEPLAPLPAQDDLNAEPPVRRSTRTKRRTVQFAGGTK